MRIKHPMVGDTRERSGFLFFPKTINYETRWLEWARWEQERRDSFNGYWLDTYWIDKEWSDNKIKVEEGWLKETIEKYKRSNDE